MKPKFTTVKLSLETHRKVKMEAAKRGMLVWRLIAEAVEFYFTAKSKGQAA